MISELKLDRAKQPEPLLDFYKEVLTIVKTNHGSVRTELLEKALSRVDGFWWKR
jgi:hypothetical protein